MSIHLSTSGGAVNTAKLAILLGVLSIIGPLATSSIIPALPTMSRELGADPSVLQLSLTTYFVALAIGQLIVGPITDTVGRRVPIVAGLSLFIATSLLASFSQSGYELAAWRFVQGLGACAVILVPRAIIRDLHAGTDAARLMSLVLLVVSVSPTFAPMIGSWLTETLHWPAVFWFAAATGLIGLLLATTILPETHPVERRSRGGLVIAFHRYRELIIDRRFLAFGLAAAFTQATFTAYLTGGSFAYIDVFNLSSLEYSVILGIGAGIWVLVAQFVPNMLARFTAMDLIRWSSISGSLSMLILAVGLSAGLGGLVLLISMAIFWSATLSVVMVPAQILALEPYGEAAGSAAALSGSLHFVMSALASAAVSAFGVASPAATGWAMAAFAIAGTVASEVGRRVVGHRVSIDS